MINLQSPEGISTRNDGALEVHSIFPTIQGEGPFVGEPATFVRLAGCNLQCAACDTDYTSKRELMTPDQILSKIGKPSLIVLTGGEPFRQSIGEFVKEALRRNHRVQIETNGTLYQHDLPYGNKPLTIVCSPKTPKLQPDLFLRISAFKYILDAEHVDPDDGLPTRSMGVPMRIARPLALVPVFVQPLDEQNPDRNRINMDAAVESCMKYGYRLSVQIHKIVGLE